MTLICSRVNPSKRLTYFFGENRAVSLHYQNLFFGKDLRPSLPIVNVGQLAPCTKMCAFQPHLQWEADLDSVNERDIPGHHPNPLSKGVFYAPPEALTTEPCSPSSLSWGRFLQEKEPHHHHPCPQSPEKPLRKTNWGARMQETNNLPKSLQKESNHCVSQKPKRQWYWSWNWHAICKIKNRTAQPLLLNLHQAPAAGSLSEENVAIAIY